MGDDAQQIKKKTQTSAPLCPTRQFKLRLLQITGIQLRKKALSFVINLRENRPLALVGVGHESIDSDHAHPILVHSHLCWDWVWQRPQQFLSRLSQRHKILFIETIGPDPALAVPLARFRQLRGISRILPFCACNFPNGDGMMATMWTRTPAHRAGISDRPDRRGFRRPDPMVLRSDGGSVLSRGTWARS